MSNTDVVAANLQGMYRDVLRDLVGAEMGSWLAQERHRHRLPASPGGLHARGTDGTLGIRGLQVGAGLAAWDQPPGPPPPTAGQVALVDPHPFTVPVADLQIDFLNLTTDSVSTDPTNRLQIVANLSPGVPSWPDANHATSTLREFGLVGAAEWGHRADQLRDASRHCERPHQHARTHDLAGVLYLERRAEMAMITPDTFDPLRSYISVRLQQGVPMVDADWNEAHDVRKFEVQAFLKWFVGNGVPEGNDGFRIAGLAPAVVEGFCHPARGRRGTRRNKSRGAGITARRALSGGWDGCPHRRGSQLSRPAAACQPGWSCHALASLLGVPTIADIPNGDDPVVVYLDVWERLVTPDGGAWPGA